MSEVIVPVKTWKIVLIVFVVLVIAGGFLYVNRHQFGWNAPGMGKSLSGYIPGLSNIPAGTLLVDYFEQQTGIIVLAGESAQAEGGYYEITLCAHSDTQLQLDVYEREHEGADERQKTYYVPAASLNEVYRVIDRYAMKNWNSGKGSGGGPGVYYVCKFYRNGELVRVSSDQMPEDGRDAFAELKALLLSLISDH